MRRLLALPLTLLIFSCAPATTADRTAWMAELDLLEDHLASAYANLEWAMEAGVDPYALDQLAREDIAAARFRFSARGAIGDFLEGFGDPHLRMKKGNHLPRAATSAGGEGIDPLVSAREAMSLLGFGTRDRGFRLGFDDLPGFESVETTPADPFAWGVFDLEDGRRAGVLRIAHFGVDGYADVAEALWPDFAAGLTEPCDGWCQWDFWVVVQNRLLELVAEGVRVLERRGIDALLVDVTGNGGGTDWAGVVPRILAPPLEHCPDSGYVKHAHHTDGIASRRDRLGRLLEDLSLTPQARRSLQSARAALDSTLAIALRPCDRRQVFSDSGVVLDCTQVVRVSGCGPAGYLPPDALAGVEHRESVFSALRFRYEEGVWTGPLFVVMDRHTASASEQFVSLLKANDAATLLGESTLGAGCGYTGGGIPIHLPRLDVTVFLSDCVRYQGNGRNELDGIEPDLPLDWSGNNRDKARAIRAAVVTAID